MKRVFLVLMLVLGVNVFAGYGATEFSKKVQTFEETGKVMNYSSEDYNTPDYIFTSVTVSYKAIDNIYEKGYLIIQDRNGNFYSCENLHGDELYDTLVTDVLDTRTLKLAFITNDEDELNNMAESHNFVLMSVDDALKLMSKAREYR